MARKYRSNDRPTLRITGATAKPNGTISEVRGNLCCGFIKILIKFRRNDFHPIELAWDGMRASL